MRKGRLLFSKFLVKETPQLVELMLTQIKFQLEKILPENEICLVPCIGTSPMFDSIPDGTSEELLPEYDVTMNMLNDTHAVKVIRIVEDEDGST